MNILEVQDLCKTYGKGDAAVHALRHATFSVRKGEFIAIVGESGSGKSTLLNVIGALDSATSGKVWIDGQDIFSMPEKKTNGVPSAAYRIHFSVVQSDSRTECRTEHHIPASTR